MIEKSGIHPIGETQRQLWLELQGRLSDILPFADANKLSDEDLAYRFLIARQWNVDLAEKLIRDYLIWRQANQVDAVLTESFPADLPRFYPMGFHGFDKDGRPVYYERPDPKGIAQLLQSYEKSVLLRWHYCVIERGRERYRLAGHDRLTIILDASQIGMSLLTNTTAIGFLKEVITGDQVKFPEHMMYLFVINAPMVFSTLWNLVRPMVDERTQKKVHIWRGNYLRELQNFIDIEQIPNEFGGKGGPFQTMCTDAAAYRVALEAVLPIPSLRPTSSTPPPNSPPPATPPAQERQSPSASWKPPSLPPKPLNVQFPACADDATLLTSTSKPPYPRQRNDATKTFHTAQDDEDDEESWDTARSLSDDSIHEEDPPDGATSEDNLAEVVEELHPQVPPKLSDDLYLNPPLCLEKGADPKGFPTIQCWHKGKFIAETRNNLIVQHQTEALVAELRLEEGHGWRVVVQLHDRHRAVRFCFMRRRLHKEVQVFLCGRREAGRSPPPESPTSSSGRRSLQHLSKPVEERLYIMSCLPPKGGAPGDWVARPRPTEWAVHHRGDLVYWGGSLKDHEPELMFAFAMAVTHLWHWK